MYISVAAYHICQGSFPVVCLEITKTFTNTCSRYIPTIKIYLNVPCYVDFGSCLMFGLFIDASISTQVKLVGKSVA